MIVVFFFQAEDGIRDLVRSRGLGDVYKRQPLSFHETPLIFYAPKKLTESKTFHQLGGQIDVAPVSYTHLTLPTSDLV